MININNKGWEELQFLDIEKLLSSADDETFFFEFKSDEESPTKLVKEVSAFSNTYGGYIFLGINDNKTIGGCTKWTEQRIHTTIHDSITPVPIFDVKKFNSGSSIILVIKVEEGTLPPYITNKGQIFQRVSSGSFPINDAGKLSQLYNKRSDQLVQIKNKIELNEIRIDSTFPQNLCAYLDLGFSVACSETTHFEKNFYSFDFSPIAEFIKSKSNDFSISRLGYSVLISIGNITATSNNGDKSLLNSGANNFIEIMSDGSVKSRLLLTTTPGDDKVDIYHIAYCYSIFRNIYKMIFDCDLPQKYVYAQKYERLIVIKQFVPYYEIKAGDELGSYLSEHRNKYGNNLIIESSRLPKNNYAIIDKRRLNTCGLEYDTDNLIQSLFFSVHFNLGFIDDMKEL